MHKFIRLNSGNKFHFKKIDPESICIEDIAHSLSQQCRFAGHTSSFYSVAEHCVRGSLLVPDEFKLDFLLHDASEAYMGDLNNPLKSIIPEFKKIEESLDRVIAEKFGTKYPHHIEIKKADLIMLATEMRDLMPGLDYHDLDYPPTEKKIVSWTSEFAKIAFMNKFLEYDK